MFYISCKFGSLIFRLGFRQASKISGQRTVFKRVIDSFFTFVHTYKLFRKSGNVERSKRFEQF